MKTCWFQCKTSDFASLYQSKFFNLGTVRNWCWHYCPMGKGRDQFLSRSEISKSFMCIYFPLIKKKKKRNKLKNHWLKILCVSSSTRTNTCSSFPPDKHFAERQHFMFRWLLQQEGNLSPLSVAVFGQLCLRVIRVPCPLAHHLA